MLYRIVLYFIHKCIDIFRFLQLLYRNIFSFVLHYLSLLTCFLKLQTVTFKKLPSHVGIIICEDQISFSDISNLIIWSLCLGIHHISIYDSSGYVKSNGAELYKQMTFKKDLLLKKRSCCFNIIFTDGKLPFSYNVTIKNGHRIDDIYVYLLSQGDGKQQIIEATKNVCGSVKKEPKLLQQFQAQNFNQYIKDIVDIPDPELILLFGLSGSLIGYLPWHIRLSEIIFQITHHNICFEQFRQALQKYSKCEQRFGK